MQGTNLLRNAIIFFLAIKTLYFPGFPVSFQKKSKFFLAQNEEIFLIAFLDELLWPWEQFLGKNINIPGNFREFQRKFHEREIFPGQEFPAANSN